VAHVAVAARFSSHFLKVVKLHRHLRALLKDGDEIPGDPFACEQPVTEQLRVTV